MNIQGIHFDNTLSVKRQAENFKDDNHTGNETQLYNIGMQVISTATATYRIDASDNAIITDVYTDNGYYYYTVSYKGYKNKIVNYTFRQRDIMGVN